MALYRRGRVWYADYYVHGERMQESTGTGNRREAEKFYALRISEVERQVFAKPIKITFQDFGKQYLDHAKSHKRSWLRDEQMLRQLLRFFGNIMLSEIKVWSIERYQQERVREVCPATVNRELALLKHMFNLAERWDLHHGKNPARMVKFLAEDNLRFQTLSDAEERALLACSPPYLQDMIVFALNTGLRSGDIFKLQWEEVDLERRRLKMLVEKTRKLLSIPLNDAAYSVLEAWYASRKGPYVFFNQMTGDRFRDLKAGFKLACKQAGLEGITWHTLRHTFASRLVRNGADIVTVKELLGHSTIVVTMRYAHTNEEEKKRAVYAIRGSDRVVTVLPKPRRTRQ